MERGVGRGDGRACVTHTQMRTARHAHVCEEYMFLKACEKVKLRTVLFLSLTHTHTPFSTATMRVWHCLTLSESQFQPQHQPRPDRATASWACFTLAPALWTAASATVFTFPLCHTIAQGLCVIRTVDIAWGVLRSHRKCKMHNSYNEYYVYAMLPCLSVEIEALLKIEYVLCAYRYMIKLLINII